MTETRLAGDVTHGTAHPGNAGAAEEAGPSRPGRRRPPPGVLALAAALAVAIGAIIAIVTFIAPLAGAPGLPTAAMPIASRHSPWAAARFSPAATAADLAPPARTRHATGPVTGPCAPA